MTRLSRHIGRFGAVLAVALLPALPGVAQAGDPFVVTVAVDGLESPEGEVRDAAVMQAEADALGLVLRRLTAARDHGRLPPAEGPNVAGYIRDMTILPDGTRVRVATRDDAIRQLLNGLGITFTETPAPRLVVVPIYQGADGAVLWSGANPWLDAWQVYDGATGLADLAIPFGEFGDLDALNTQEALDGNPAALRALAQRYEAAGALVALYRPDGAQADIRLTVSADGDWQGSTSLTVPHDGGIPAASLDRAAAAVERLWVEQQIKPSYDGPVSTIELTARFASLAEWIGIRHALDQAAVVEHYDVPALGGQGARIILQHYADLATLQQELAGAGLVVEQAGFAPSGLPAFSLRVTGSAPPPQGFQAADTAANGIGTPLSLDTPPWGQTAPAQSPTIEPRIPTLRFEP